MTDQPDQPKASGPIETKVTVASWSAASTGAITWCLVNWVPSLFHVTLAPQLATFLAFVLPVAAGTAGGYLAKHTPRLEEALQALEEAFPPGSFHPPTPVIDLGGPGSRPVPLPVQFAPGGPIVSAPPPPSP